jgi:hypothetical protein
MIKGIIVTFEYDTETELVSNVQCNVDGVEKKKRVTKAKAKVEEEMAAEPLITREETKLVFNNKVVADMAIEHEDRIVIKWEKSKDKKVMFPIIGKDIAFDEEGNGNKVTKTNTVGFKGKQNLVLAELGAIFTIEPYVTDKYAEGVWKLISTTSATSTKTLEDTIKAVEKVNADIITEKDEEIEIDEMQFTLNT